MADTSKLCRLLHDAQQPYHRSACTPDYATGTSHTMHATHILPAPLHWGRSRRLSPRLPLAALCLQQAGLGPAATADPGGYSHRRGRRHAYRAQHWCSHSHSHAHKARALPARWHEPGRPRPPPSPGACPLPEDPPGLAAVHTAPQVTASAAGEAGGRQRPGDSLPCGCGELSTPFPSSPHACVRASAPHACVVLLPMHACCYMRAAAFHACVPCMRHGAPHACMSVLPMAALSEPYVCHAGLRELYFHACLLLPLLPLLHTGHMHVCCCS